MIRTIAIFALLLNTYKMAFGLRLFLVSLISSFFVQRAYLLVLQGGGDGSESPFLVLLTEEKQMRIQLEKTVEGLSNRLNLLDTNQCSCAAKDVVAFMATLTETIHNPAKDHVIVFDHVITNVGAAYNHMHGIFKAPVNGTYHFTFETASPATVEPTAYLDIIMVKNNVSVGAVFMGANPQMWLQKSITSTLDLKQGDEMLVKVLQTGGVHDIYGGDFTHLSGFLIN